MNPYFVPSPLRYITAIITENRVIYNKDFGDFRKGKV
jgi:methylthioribose-1-phosphate isomerase